MLPPWHANTRPSLFPTWSWAPCLVKKETILRSPNLHAMWKGLWILCNNFEREKFQNQSFFILNKKIKKRKQTWFSKLIEAPLSTNKVIMSKWPPSVASHKAVIPFSQKLISINHQRNLKQKKRKKEKTWFPCWSIWRSSIFKKILTISKFPFWQATCHGDILS